MAFFDWADHSTTHLDRIALKERYHEAICASIKAQRAADKAALDSNAAEIAYVAACDRVRKFEQELKQAVTEGL